MHWIKKVLVGLLVIIVAIQFIQPAHNTAATVLPTDITNTLRVPGNILAIFKNSCYDCHSNNTRYPWYVNTQPLGWIMAGHIKNGKENLNFSDFGSYSKRKQANKLRAIGTSITEGSMPLSSYLLMHSNAKINKQNKDAVIEWISKTKDSLLSRD